MRALHSPIKLILITSLCLGILLLGTYCNIAPEPEAEEITCYANYEGPLPPTSVYNGPTYVLGQDWPKELPAIPKDAPWPKYDSVNNDNVVQFMNDMKAWVFKQMVPADFRMDKVNWYAIPFQPREAIRGMYDGNNQPAYSYDPQQTEDAINFTTELYNNVGGYTIGQVFGDCNSTDYQINVNSESVIFPEGTVVIKLAMTSLPDEQAPILAGAFSWDIYADGSKTIKKAGKPFNPAITKVKLIQMDIIVKDKRLAPKTGWVFGTLVYDASAAPVGYTGKDENLKGLYKMVPLGAMTGMDPNITVTNFTTADTTLKETFMNPLSPAYTVPLLGWGGRLSGPIDGAQGFSSCMGCHATAQWNTKDFDLNKQVFNTRYGPPMFIPPSTPPSTADSTSLAYTRNLHGSKGWCDTTDPYFKDIMGCPDLSSDWIGLDYDFVMFKGILNGISDQKKEPRQQVKAFH